VAAAEKPPDPFSCLAHPLSPETVRLPGTFVSLKQTLLLVVSVVGVALLTDVKGGKVGTVSPVTVIAIAFVGAPDAFVAVNVALCAAVYPRLGVPESVQPSCIASPLTSVPDVCVISACGMPCVVR
jgi:hypothetical protein